MIFAFSKLMVSFLNISLKISTKPRNNLNLKQQIGSILGIFLRILPLYSLKARNITSYDKNYLSAIDEILAKTTTLVVIYASIQSQCIRVVKSLTLFAHFPASWGTLVTRYNYQVRSQRTPSAYVLTIQKI